MEEEKKSFQITFATIIYWLKHDKKLQIISCDFLFKC